MKTPVRTRLLSALLSLVMLVSLLPVSVFAAEPASGTWEKVTEAQEDWSGQYLIVYESGGVQPRQQKGSVLRVQRLL